MCLYRLILSKVQESIFGIHVAFLFCIAGIFEGFIGFLVSGAITLVLWYGGKLVYENHQDPSTGITPGVFTGRVKHGYLTLACIKKQHV